MGQQPGAASAQEQTNSISSTGGSSSIGSDEASCSAPQRSSQKSVDWAELNNSMMQSLHHMITGIITATIARVCALPLS